MGSEGLAAADTSWPPMGNNGRVYLWPGWYHHRADAAACSTISRRVTPLRYGKAEPCVGLTFRCYYALRLLGLFPERSILAKDTINTVLAFKATNTVRRHLAGELVFSQCFLIRDQSNDLGRRNYTRLELI